MTTNNAAHLPNARFKDLAAFNRAVFALGEKAGAGPISEANFLLECSIASREGLLPDTLEAAGEALKQFRKGTAKHGNEACPDYDTTGKPNKKGNFDQRRSVVKAMVHAAKLNESFPDFLERIRPELDSGRKSGKYTSGAMWDIFYKLAIVQREVAAATKAGADGMCREPDDSEIMAKLGPKAPSEKEYSEAKAIDTIIKSLEKLIDGKPPCSAGTAEYANAAVAQMRQAAALLTFVQSKAKFDALNTK